MASRHHGLPAIASVDGVELASRFGDGPGLQTYLGSSPWGARDEMGLFFAAAIQWAASDDTHHRDAFSMVDDIMAEHAASAASFLESAQSYWGTIGEFTPFVGGAMALVRLSAGAGTAWDALGILGGGGAKALSFLGKFVRSYDRALNARRAARLAGEAFDRVDWHHVIPRFMSNWRAGPVIGLSPAAHRRYHKILDEVLYEHGLPISVGGTSAWTKLIEQHGARAMAGRMYDALEESVRRFASDPLGRDMMNEFHEAWGLYIIKLLGG